MIHSTFIKAVYLQDIEEIDRMLGEGYDINMADSDGRTPLMHAVLASNADEQFVASLIGRGADVTIADRVHKWTALHFAARDQRTDLVAVLLRSGSEINATDAFGNTPLLRAIGNNREVDPALVGTLIQHGADPDKANNYGVSARAFCRQMERYDILQLFGE